MDNNNVKNAIIKSMTEILQTMMKEARECKDCHFAKCIVDTLPNQLTQDFFSNQRKG